MNNIFKMKDIFNIYQPFNDDLIRFEKTDKKKGIPFVARTSKNNGISCFVKHREGFINEAGKITISLDGSTGSVFYHSYDFCAGQNLWIIEPKNFKLSTKASLLLVSVLKNFSKSTSYAVNLTKTRLQEKRVLLPSDSFGKVDWTEFEKLAERSVVFRKSLPKISVNSNENFRFGIFGISDLFDEIRYPKNYKISSFKVYDKKLDDMIPFVSAKSHDNGVTGFVQNEPKLIKEQNVLTIANNGSVGYAMYRPYEFIGNNDITILAKPKFTLNKKTGLFVASAIQKAAKGRFSYGNKLKGDKINDLHIKLPINEFGEFDANIVEKIISIKI